MKGNEEQVRQWAIERYLKKESPSAIYMSMGLSKSWFYKWLGRYRAGEELWFKERDRRPLQNPNRTSQEITEMIRLIRLELYNKNLFCGAQAILWALEDLNVEPLPSERTIARILSREGLTMRRTGRYEPKGIKYPKWPAGRAGAVHQSDFVGPCYLRGKQIIKFYSLNSVDLATGRCATEPLLSKGKGNTINAFWASWLRLGIPKIQQLDNEMVFYGSPTYPRGMGQLIRLCLSYGVEPCFIPVREPWRNGVVEKFNHHWLQGLLQKVKMHTVAELKDQTLSFEHRHNSRYRYSKLNGKTPLQSLDADKSTLRFPDSKAPPIYPLPKPDLGCYHLIRFIRSDGLLDVFGEKFNVPSECIYEYVRATVDVSEQRLRIHLDDQAVDEKEYAMR
jgi:putative transposase